MINQVLVKLELGGRTDPSGMVASPSKDAWLQGSEEVGVTVAVIVAVGPKVWVWAGVGVVRMGSEVPWAVDVLIAATVWAAAVRIRFSVLTVPSPCLGKLQDARKSKMRRKKNLLN